MCGVCGILATGPRFPCDVGLVSAMRETMHHRGPDDGGSWSSDDGRVALGHRRLSIVDLSPAGHNPMPNEDGTVWITYNGEVYNHGALRAELEAKGHVYRSRTDTETILHLYEEEGPACVERLHGMFAFAIWDARREELFLARDRLGIKPLYYAQPSGGFLFASEIKALLQHPSLVADLDEEALYHFLTFVSTPAPLTMFAGISKLRPAERLVVSARGEVRSEIWWSPFSAAVAEEVATMDEDELTQRLVDLLRESIRKRMMADVPFGVFLSGGLDSSTNVALMSELIDQPVRTYSIGFTGKGEHNEFEYARAVASRFATEHHETEIGSDQALAFLPALVQHQDEPIADPTCVPLHFVARLARESGTIVVQVGEGADELFHGYEHYHDHARFQREWTPRIRRLPLPVRAGARRAAVILANRYGRGVTRTRFLDDAVEGRNAFWGGAIAFTGKLKESVLGGSHPDFDSYKLVERLWEEAASLYPRADLLQRMTYVELKQRLAELLLMRVDKMTMATSVEARVPFLDHELVEFALALPERMKVRGGSGKYLLKRAVEPLLPREIVHRRKQGFSPPMGDWLRGPLGEQARRETLRSGLVGRGVLDARKMERLWESHLRGQGDWSFQLWTLWNVCAWYDRWVARGHA